jgi:hypothetical protein
MNRQFYWQSKSAGGSALLEAAGGLLVMLTFFMLLGGVAEKYYHCNELQEIIETALHSEDLAGSELTGTGGVPVTQALSDKVADRIVSLLAENFSQVTPAKYGLEVKVLQVAVNQQNGRTESYRVITSANSGRLAVSGTDSDFTAYLSGSVGRNIGTQRIIDAENTYLPETFLIFARILMKDDGGLMSLLGLMGLSPDIAYSYAVPLRVNIKL